MMKMKTSNARRFWGAFFALLSLSALTASAATPSAVTIDGATGLVTETSRSAALMSTGATRTNINPKIVIDLIAVLGPKVETSIQAGFQQRAISLLPSTNGLGAITAPANGNLQGDPTVAERAFWHRPENNLGSSTLPLWMGKTRSAGDALASQRGTVTYGTARVRRTDGGTFKPTDLHWSFVWEGTPINPVHRSPVGADNFGPGAMGRNGSTVYDSGSLDREVTELSHAGFAGFLTTNSSQEVSDVVGYVNQRRAALVISVWLTDSAGTVIAASSVKLEVPPSPLPSPALSWGWKQQGVLNVTAGGSAPVVIESATTAVGPWTLRSIGANRSLTLETGTPGASEIFRAYTPEN